ncbi:MAG TPA: folylpolyglutamate synthase/dihydrofolate synthase family protein [Vicinamibacterales bacterium]|nr:folylpolyglutamate synthase/dihydrofolate synthase family protein [Vicinamibacterales bacterium]
MLDRLFALETFGIKLGLENISRLCSALGHPERQFVTLHIAGTNGKGSVAAMTHAALVAAGTRAARYTSPHLTDITERFVIGDAPVTATALEAVASRVLDCAEAMQARGELRVPPTFFEATTATAFELFRETDMEVAVIEVGLGGRFDATNVISPAAGAITTIGFDHQQYLGHSLAEIAFEKAGIIKPGMTVVTGTLPEDARTVIQRVADERGARLFDASEGVEASVEMSDGVAHLSVTTPRRAYGPMVLGLRGRHQADNALVAIRLLEEVEAHGIVVPAEAIASGLGRPQWPARLELFTLDNGRRVLLDAAHNLDGAAALADYLRQWHRDRPALVLGVMRDKDVDAMLALLLPEVSSIIATAAPTPRAMSPDDLARRAADVAAAIAPARRMPITTVSDPEEAVHVALERSHDVCVAGSIFLAGAVRADLQRRAILR